jgi:hypothetical protein
MNGHLRGLDDLPEIESRIDRASHGISQLPPVPGTTFRGAHLDPDLLAKYTEVGAQNLDNGFWSSSKSLKTAQDFADNVIFQIEGKTGVDVHQISRYAPESEIVFQRGRTFETTEVDVQAQYTVITVREVTK